MARFEQKNSNAVLRDLKNLSESRLTGYAGKLGPIFTNLALPALQIPSTFQPSGWSMWQRG